MSNTEPIENDGKLMFSGWVAGPVINVNKHRKLKMSNTESIENDGKLMFSGWVAGPVIYIVFNLQDLILFGFISQIFNHLMHVQYSLKSNGKSDCVSIWSSDLFVPQIKNKIINVTVDWLVLNAKIYRGVPMLWSDTTNSGGKIK